MELEDAIHTSLLTLREGFEGEMNSTNIEVGIIGADRKFRILDVEVPMLVVPVRPGRNMTTIIEVAARNHLLKQQGKIEQPVGKAAARDSMALMQHPYLIEAGTEGLKE